jgi:D-alanyl-D-alanine dipeptidase
MLARADSLLRAAQPDLRLLLLDCVRPLSAQRQLWAAVQGTPLQPYVANPNRGSMHNYGVAVDITLATAAGEELDMGSPFDFLGPESQPREEERLRREGKLSAAHLAKRRLLRGVMERAGFRPLAIEWWHFEAFDKEWTRRRYTLVE